MSYFVFENLDIKKNDIMVKRDTSESTGIIPDDYFIIDSYDSILHKINVKKSNGELAEGDEVYIYRDNGTSEEPQYDLIGGFGETGCYVQFYGANSCVSFSGPNDSAPLCATAGATFAKLHKITTIKNSLNNFEYKSDDISPYARFIEGVGQSGDYFAHQNICGSTGTLLYQYIDDSGNLPTDIDVISLEKYTIKENDKKRTIRLLSPSLMGQVSSEVSFLLKGGVSRGTTVVLE
jgi:hypothetical protein